MKGKLFVLALSIFILIFTLANSGYLNYSPVTIFRNKTNIGGLKLSGKTWDEGNRLLNQSLETPIYINLISKSRSVTPKEIGLGIDSNKLSKLTKTCRYSFLRIFCQNTSNEKIDPNDILTVDNQVLESFIDELNSEVQLFADNTIISFEDFSFRAPSPDASVFINRSQFDRKEGLAQLLGNGEKMTINLETKPLDSVDAQHQATTDLIDNMAFPLLIKYGRNEIYIQNEDIQSFVDTKTKDGYLSGFVNEEAISNYLQELHEQYATHDVQVMHNEAVEVLKRTLLYRAADYEINNAVILPLDGKPKTNGELHEVYIELIKSQQRAYRFEYGELTKVYVVSTGLTWETPAGQYQVLGKQKMTISYYDAWYMPNYLPIGTINGYRFGFHEIPYHLDGAGNIYSRDPNTMGSPATGGCIQLNAADSLELFDWAEIGTPVYIYE
jgi:hypothetical protein